MSRQFGSDQTGVLAVSTLGLIGFVLRNWPEGLIFGNSLSDRWLRSFWPLGDWVCLALFLQTAEAKSLS